MIACCPMRFVLLDRVVELSRARARALKCVSLSDDVFDDHFVGSPLFPGTLVLEAMAQLAGLLVEEDARAEGVMDHLAVLVGVDGARFLRPVRPGDQLVVEASSRGGQEHARVDVCARVDDEIAARARLAMVLTDGHAPALLAQRALQRTVWLANGE